MAIFNFSFDTVTKTFKADFDGKALKNLDSVTFYKMYGAETEKDLKGMLDVITMELQEDNKMCVKTHTIAAEDGSLVQTTHKEELRKGIAKTLRSSFQT
jgi:hypothetical protein